MIVKDNKIFESIQSYGHKWKWDDEKGLLVLQKKTVESQSEYVAWNEILQSLEIEKMSNGSLRIKNANYSSNGFEITVKYQFPKEEYEFHLKKWMQERWPIQFLTRDHYGNLFLKFQTIINLPFFCTNSLIKKTGAKVLYDNQVFLLIETYGHQWKWDDQEGLSILFKRNAEDKAEFTPWDKIAQIVPVCKTPQVSEKKEQKKKEFGRGTNFP